MVRPEQGSARRRGQTFDEGERVQRIGQVVRGVLEHGTRPPPVAVLPADLLGDVQLERGTARVAGEGPVVVDDDGLVIVGLEKRPRTDAQAFPVGLDAAGQIVPVRSGPSGVSRLSTISGQSSGRGCTLFRARTSSARRRLRRALTRYGIMER